MNYKKSSIKRYRYTIMDMNKIRLSAWYVFIYHARFFFVVVFLLIELILVVVANVVLFPPWKFDQIQAPADIIYYSHEKSGERVRQNIPKRGKELILFTWIRTFHLKFISKHISHLCIFDWMKQLWIYS